MKYHGFTRQIESEYLDIFRYPEYPVLKTNWLSLIFPPNVNGDCWFPFELWEPLVLSAAKLSESQFIYCSDIFGYYVDGEPRSIDEDGQVKKVRVSWEDFEDFQRTVESAYCIDDSRNWLIVNPGENYLLFAGVDYLIIGLVKKLIAGSSVSDRLDIFKDEDLLHEFVEYKGKIFERLYKELKVK